MALVLNEDWTAEVAGQMHKYRISNIDLAEKCGYSPSYLSTVMNGNKAFQDDYSAEKTKDRIQSSLKRLILEKLDEVETGGTDEN